MRHLYIAVGVAVVLGALAVASAHDILGRETTVDRAFAILVFLALTSDIVAPLLLLLRRNRPAIWIAGVGAAFVVGAVAYALIALRPGDPRTAPIELLLVSAVFLAPALAAAIAAGGHRSAAVALASVSTFGMIMVYAQALRFGAFSWGLPLGALLHVAVLGFIAAGGLAITAVLLTQRPDRLPPSAAGQ